MSNAVEKTYIDKLRTIFEGTEKELQSDKVDSVLRSLKIARDLPIELLKNLVAFARELEIIEQKLFDLTAEDIRLAGLIG